jgi:hypothetical protein
MRVINAPYYGHIYNNEIAVFLAGGIKGCRDWQAELIDRVKFLEQKNEQESKPSLVVLNPRAGVFDANDPECYLRQVEWEHHYLEQAHVVSFWFSKETLNPITLYEFGYQMAGVKAMGKSHRHRTNPRDAKQIVVGADREYAKLDDVKAQSKLANWDGRIHHNLVDLEDDIRELLKVFR